MFNKLPNVEAIMALDVMNGLSKNGNIPWKSKTDMDFFKNKTVNNIVIMGSKTLISLPNSQPLKNRTNIILTNEKDKYLNKYKTNKLLFFLNFEETLKFINQNKDKYFFVIGGNEIYNLFLPFCSSIWITRIKKYYNCDLFFNYNLSIYNINKIYEDSELEIMCLK
jgi:dihydrofolate reductase